MKYFKITVLKAHNSSCYKYSTLTFYVKARDIN